MGTRPLMSLKRSSLLITANLFFFLSTILTVVHSPVQSHYFPIFVFTYIIRAFIDEIDEYPSFPVHPYVRSPELPSVCFRITLSEEPWNRYDCLYPLIAGAECELRASECKCTHIIAHRAFLLHRGMLHLLSLLGMLLPPFRLLHIPVLDSFHCNITSTLYKPCGKSRTLFLYSLILDLMKKSFRSTVIVNEALC